ncbi:MAG: fibronectin type III domain-containing protein, partial [Elusimicrobia bacterium]|nr:fibronectin type III domain-containing protein [Elusimicrobiota bacterium]
MLQYFSRRLAFCAALLAGAVPLWAGPPMESAGYRLERSAASAGGDAGWSNNYVSTAAIAEEALVPVAGSTATSTNYVLAPAFGNILAFPGRVLDLAERGDVSVSSATLLWSAPGYDGMSGALVPGTSYFIRVASYTVPDTFGPSFANIVFSTKDTIPGQGVGTGATELVANTTWYAGLWTLDAAGNIGLASNCSTFTTLAEAPQTLTPAFLNVYLTSVTANWAALPLASAHGASRTCEGYRLEASSTNFGALSPGGVVHSSTTYDVLSTTLTVLDPPLKAGTTYYFRVGSLNWSGAADYAVLGSTKTELAAFPPVPMDQRFPALSSWSATVAWDPNDGNPSGSFYTLDASTDSEFRGDVYSSSTYGSSWDMYYLRTNTTYYFRVTVHTESSYASTLFGSTPTLAALPQAAPVAFPAVHLSSMSVAWILGDNPAGKSSFTVVLSTSPSYSGVDPDNRVLASTRPAGGDPSATIDGLSANTTCHLFVAALNHAGVPTEFVALGSTATKAAAPAAAANTFSGVGQTSAAFTWNLGGNRLEVTTYTVVMSTAGNCPSGCAANVSMDTVAITNPPAATLQGLAPNGTYYLFAAARGHDGRLTEFAALGTTATLAAAPQPGSPAYSAMASDGFTLNWSASNQAGTTYYAQLARDGGFAQVVRSSQTRNLNATFSGLDVNTTYYARVSVYSHRAGTWTYETGLGSTATLAAVPAAAAVPFAGVALTSMTVSWLGNGNPVNVTSYTVVLSRDNVYPNVRLDNALLASTAPAGAVLSATMDDPPLELNVTYYLFVAALNHNGVPSSFVMLGATSTLAGPPTDPAFVGVGQASATLSWTAVPAAGYGLSAALSEGGAAVASSSNTDGAAASLTVYGLDANTTHYFRAGSYNWNSVLRETVADSTSTLAKAVNGLVINKTDVGATSMTVNWAILPANPMRDSCEGYVLQAATADAGGLGADFTGETVSSITFSRLSSKLTFLDLMPGTTYTFRLGTLNYSGAVNFSGVTVTSFTNISPKTWTGGGGNSDWNTAANWSPAGVPTAGSPVTINLRTANVTVTAASAISFSSLTIGGTGNDFHSSLYIASTVARGGSVLIYGNGGLVQGTTKTLVFEGDMTMLRGSSITHRPDAGEPAIAEVDIEVTGTLDMQAGATVTVSARGFAGGVTNGGDGYGPGRGEGNSASSGGGTGAGHGGAGGTAVGGNPGSPYEDEQDPVLPGSGGGGGDAAIGTNTGGPGGGAVLLKAGTFILNGFIDANGGQGGPGQAGSAVRAAGGGGSGGTVNIQAGTLQGGGTVQALGGVGGPDADAMDDPGGGGGGGRVAINVTGSGALCEIKVSTDGGVSGGGSSGPGAGGSYSSTMTLAAPLFSGSLPEVSSITWSWSLVTGGREYQIFSATETSRHGSPMSPPFVAGETQFVTEDLPANTTASFYLRALSCGVSTDTARFDLATRALSPAAAAGAAFPVVEQNSVQVSWSRNGNPQSVTTYTVILATSVAAWQESAFNVQLDTVPAGPEPAATLSGLYPNTTYYLFVRAVNHAGLATPFASLGSTATLARAPTALPRSFLDVRVTSATAAWAAMPSEAQQGSSNTAKGYVLEASSTNFGAYLPGGVVSSSATFSLPASTLTVWNPPLNAGTTYYFRVAALNWQLRPTYLVLGSTKTKVDVQPPVPLAQRFPALSTYSVTVAWNPNDGNPDGTRYVVDAATDSQFRGDVYSSGTFGSSFEMRRLLRDTTYYFRVTAASESATAATLFGATCTWAAPPAAFADSFASVHFTSMSVIWALDLDPVGVTSFTVALSTEPAYDSADPDNRVLASTLPAGAVQSATLAGLDANTTYYLFVAALNHIGAAGEFVAMGSAATLAAAPGAAASPFGDVWPASATVSWQRSANRLGVTTYTATLGLTPACPGSVGVDTVSVADPPTATLEGLSPNATYYLCVAAWSHSAGRLDFVAMGSTSTPAMAPGPGSPLFSTVAVDGLVLNWTGGGPPANQAGTTYYAQAALDGGFAQVLRSSATRNLFAGFSGLAANTTHFFRTSVYGHRAGTWTYYTEFGSTAALAKTVDGLVINKGDVGSTSMTVNWAILPASPMSNSCEGYVLHAATADAGGLGADFTGETVSSITFSRLSSKLAFLDLMPGTTYTFRLGTLNHSGAPNFSAVTVTSCTTIAPMTWVGGSGSWHTASNWSPPGIPSAGSPVTIDLRTANVIVTAGPPAIKFSSLTIGGPGSTYRNNLYLATGVAQGGSVLIWGNGGLTIGSTQHLFFDGDFTMVKGSSLTHRQNVDTPQNYAIDIEVSGTF